MLLCGRMSFVLGDLCQSVRCGIVLHLQSTFRWFIKKKKTARDKMEQMWENINNWWLGKKHMCVNCSLLQSFCRFEIFKIKCSGGGGGCSVCSVESHRADCESVEVGVDFCTSGGRLSWRSWSELDWTTCEGTLVKEKLDKLMVGTK